MSTNYGSIVNAYVSYKLNPDLAEWRLGYLPLIEALGPVANKRILDFGCGPANFSAELTKQGAKVIGLDADKTVIEQARLNDPGGDYRVNRGLIAQELAGMGIEAIIATFSFCLVPDRELRYLLRDMRQILGDGGQLLVLEPNQEIAHGIQYSNLHYHRKEGVQTGDYVEVTLGAGTESMLLTDDIYRTHADYRQLLEEAGFTIKKMEEPRPDAVWGEGWEVEDEFPPFLLIAAR